MSDSKPPKEGKKRGPKRLGRPPAEHNDKSIVRNGNTKPETSGTTNTSSNNPYRISLSMINPYITCSLCDGYFIDAVTVMDCLHTFCKSCLIKYFEDHNDCPSCHSLIHQSHPTHYVSFDRTLQEIVYKLVPGLQEEELRRREQFMEDRKNQGLPTGMESESEDEEIRPKRGKKPKSQRGPKPNGGAAVRNGVCGTKLPDAKEQLNGDGSGNSPDPTVTVNGDTPTIEKQCCIETDTQSHHRKDDAALIHLVPADNSNNPIQRPFIRVSVFATINTLKRTLACYLHHGDISHYNDFDIFCNNELMGRDYSILFILKTRWRDKSPDEPIRLVYKIHKDF